MSWDPIRLDTQFRELQSVCRYSASPSRRLLALSHFLGECADDTVAAEAYLLESAPEIAGSAARLELIGTDPEPYLIALDRIERLAGDTRDAFLAAALDACVRHVRVQCARLLAWGGRFEELAGLLRIKILTGTEANGSPADEDPRDVVERMADSLSVADGSAGIVLRQVLAGWTPWASERRNASIVPAVTSIQFAGEEQFKLGVLCPLEVDVYGSRSGEDRFRVSHRFVDNGHGETDDLSVAARAGRRVLGELFLGQVKRPFCATAFLPREIQAVEGRSATAAAAALFVTGALHRSLARVRYEAAHDVAITADCDENGAVLPVNPHTLHLKLAAAFHSWVRFVVVPESQRAEAEEAARSLGRGGAARRLRIIGISHVADLFHDRRITASRRTGFLKHAARVAWSEKAASASIAASVLLLTALGIVLYTPLDRNPVAAGWEGEYMLVLNRYGQVIEKIVVGSTTVNANKERPPDARNAVFYDITGDGRNEIIWVQSAQQASAVPIIRARQIGKEELLWRYDAVYEISYPHSPDIHSSNFHSIIQLSLIPDRHGPAKLVAIMNHNFFPSVLMTMDARTGSVLSRYVHPGHIRMVLPVQYLATGQRSLMMTGINNAFGRPFFAVLETQFLSGHGPATRPYIPAGYTPGAEKVYVLLPYCTIIASVPSFLFPLGDHIRMFPDRSIELRTAYRFGPRDDLLGYQTGGLLHYFARDFRHVGVGRTSGYDRSIAQLVATGQVSEAPAAEYYRQLSDQALYWDGYDWVNEPVINRRYLDRLAEARPEPVAGSREWSVGGRE